jgi:hypothetical protein
MIWMAAESLWHFLWGWATVDMIVGGIAVAIAILEPKQLDAITDLRKWAIVVAVIAFSCMGILAHGYQNGLAEKQRQWNEATAAETVAGNAARTSAVATVGPVPVDRGLLRNDPWNRGTRGVQPVGRTKGPLRWLARHRV